MTCKTITDKQAVFLKSKDKRLNFLTGSVRSGKTWVSLLKFAWFVGTSPASCEFLLCGKTITSLKRNCFGYMDELCGGYFSYSISNKEARLFGRKLHLEGANDERSENKIRGMTLGGAYCDEITLFPESFVAMLVSRLSLPGAKLYATANPDRPSHYIKEKFIDNKKLDLAHWEFTLDENTFLDRAYVEQIKKENTGVFYDRYILGKWVAAEGRIYDMFDENVHVVPSVPRAYAKYYVSCDYGTQNPTVFALWGLYDKVWYKIKEYHYSGRETNRQKTDRQFADDYVEFVRGYRVTATIVDPSAASFIAELKQRGINVIRAGNDVLSGIRLTASLLTKGAIKICDCCAETIKEFKLYSWDMKNISEDKPLKENDHHMDAVRYFCLTVLNESSRLKIMPKTAAGGFL